MVRLRSLALALALSSATANAQDVGALASPALEELSGMVVSQGREPLLWGHNDSGALPMLYRIGMDGSDLGALTVPDAAAGDWEDIAAFRDTHGAALLVADVGDNFLLRAWATLYAVRDPGRRGTLDLLWRLNFRFPDGGRDCEAVAVDPQRRDILLISKRDDPPRLYRLPLPTRTPDAVQTAEFLGTLALPPVSWRERLITPLSGRFANAPTAFDISADGRTAVVVTPRRAYLYRRGPGEDWAATLQRAPQIVGLPDFEQIEAAALSPDGQILYVGSEGQPAPYARIALPVPPADLRDRP